MSSVFSVSARWLAANPAVELMARLSYPKKIQTVGLVAGVAILLLAGQLFFSLAGQIERASLERTGLGLVQPLRAVIEPLQEHRGLANALASGDAAYREAHGPLLEAALAVRRQRVDAAFAAAEARFRQEMPALAEDPRWLAARRTWAEIENDPAPLPATVVERHGAAIAQLTGVVSAAADATHLSVDPYVGTFYLAQLVTRQLPGVIEQMARIRDLGTGVYASRELDRDQKFLLISLNTMAATGLDEARDMVKGKVTKIFNTSTGRAGWRTVKGNFHVYFQRNYTRKSKGADGKVNAETVRTLRVNDIYPASHAIPKSEVSDPTDIDEDEQVIS